MSSQSHRPRASRRSFLCGLALAATGALWGCGSDGTNSAGPPDLTGCIGVACGGCSGDSDCQGGQRCEAQTGACVDCLIDRDCPAGTLCNPTTHTCALGCNPRHGCGDAGVCQPETATCVGCLADTDCGDAALPRCDTARNTCAPCLPDNDNCGPGTYCAALPGGGYECATGCKVDPDCVSSSDDGGGDADGGSPAPSIGRCDTRKHLCVQCHDDAGCAEGTVCADGQCVPGCTMEHACPLGKTCCGGQCSNVTTDNGNCGACGNACDNGWGCCESQCRDIGSDRVHCGGCGNECFVSNGVAACSAGACVVASCSVGWSDCDQAPGNGCETHVDLDARSCGACGAACALAHATPRCFGGRCTIAACMAPFADCNGDPADGCETDVNTTLSACGACKSACATPHGTPACVQGSCRLQTCDTGYLDCNSDPKDGCEIDAQGDAANCGACQTVCSSVNGTPSCVLGACRIECAAGHGDCDGKVSSGCEIDLRGDVKHCGACGHACALAHTTARCGSGACAIAQCDAGFADCNADPADGCEVGLQADPLHCGACGSACSTRNGVAACSNGACSIQCKPGFADCNGDVTDGCEIDVTIDVLHCNGCGRACNGSNGTPSCVAGACQIACSGGFGNCDGTPGNGCEVNINNTVAHCGACGAACQLPNATPTCVAGACQVSACDAGTADCDAAPVNGCEVNIAGDASHCGACGKVCSSNNGAPSCVAGGCRIACKPGFADCNGNVADGCEIDLTTDPANCNGCGSACNADNGVPACVAGACQIACHAGWGNCDGNSANGCEVNLGNTVAHCGGCGAACQLANATPACHNGACVVSTCTAGTADCDGNPVNGCEVNIAGDTANCGGCGALCSSNHGAPSCAAGACQIGCFPGFADCNGSVLDGCEVNLGNDPQNCAACGLACNSSNGVASCAGGSCQIACAPGWGNCDNNSGNGCEVNLLVNVNSCGVCGHTCALANASASCSAGACVVATCNGGFGDCDGNPANGCEVNLTSSAAHCGSCGTACAPSHATGACMNSACVVTACNAGFADCDVSPANGCEVNIGVDPANCGGCGMACSNNNISVQSCSGGACTGMCSGAFVNCGGNKRAVGCQVDPRSDANNCGGCGVVCNNVCVGHVAATTCGASACGVTSCQNNWFDADKQCANGCECAGPVDGASCGAVTDLGQLLGPGTSVSRSQTLLPVGREIWYRVQFVRPNIWDQAFHPHIYFSQNPLDGNGNPQFSFELRSDCNTLMGCAEGGSTSGKLDWEEFYAAGDSSSPGFIANGVPGNGGTVYIRVVRNSNLTNCAAFNLIISE